MQPTQLLLLLVRQPLNGQISSFILFVLFIPLIFFYACRDEKKLEYYSSGEIKSETWFDEKINLSLYKEYYPSGNLSLSFSCRDSLLEGEVIKYYPNGKIWHKRTEKGGRKSGEYIEFFSNGNIKTKGFYLDGEPDGYSSSYDSIGRLVFINYKKEGRLVFFRKYEYAGDSSFSIKDDYTPIVHIENDKIKNGDTLAISVDFPIPTTEFRLNDFFIKCFIMSEEDFNSMVWPQPLEYDLSKGKIDLRFIVQGKSKTQVAVIQIFEKGKPNKINSYVKEPFFII